MPLKPVFASRTPAGEATRPESNNLGSTSILEAILEVKEIQLEIKELQEEITEVFARSGERTQPERLRNKIRHCSTDRLSCQHAFQERYLPTEDPNRGSTGWAPDVADEVTGQSSKQSRFGLLASRASRTSRRTSKAGGKTSVFMGGPTGPTVSTRIPSMTSVSESEDLSISWPSSISERPEINWTKAPDQKDGNMFPTTTSSSFQMVAASTSPTGLDPAMMRRLSECDGVSNKKNGQKWRWLNSTVSDPGAPWRPIYDWCSLCMCGFDLIVLPYTVAFELVPTGPMIYFTVLQLCFWTFDFVLQFLTGYIVAGELVIDTASTAKAYLKSYFFFDFLCIVSLVVSAKTEANREPEKTFLFRILRFSRLATFFRITRKWVLQAMRSNEGWTVTSQCLGFAIIILWTTHILACTWYAIGRFSPSDTGNRWLDMFHEELGDHEYYFYQYATSYHFALQNLAAGSMDMCPSNSWERNFNIICLLLGWLGGSCAVASMSTYMIEWQADWKARNHKFQLLQKFLAQNGIDDNFSERVQNFVRIKVEGVERIAEDRVQYLQLLSPFFRGLLYEQMYGPRVFRIPMFRVWGTQNVTALRNLCSSALRMTMFQISEPVFQAGHRTDACFIVVSGKFVYDQIIFPSSDDVEALESGRVVAEASLWAVWDHLGNLEANVDSGIVIVDAHMFANVLNAHAEIIDFSIQYGRRFLKCLRAADHNVNCPNDLHVPQTNYEEIVTAMDFNFRRLVGLSALESIKNEQIKFLFQSSKRVDLLQDEIDQGLCTMIHDADGKVKRMVAICVLEIVNQEREVFTKVGKLVDGIGIDKPECKLPATKLKRGEDIGLARDRFVLEVLSPFKDVVVFAKKSTSRTAGTSESCGVETSYIRSVHTGSLPDGYTFVSQPDKLSVVDLGQNRNAFVIPDENGRKIIYMFLKTEEFARYTSDDPEAMDCLLRVLHPLVETPKNGMPKHSDEESKRPLLNAQADRQESKRPLLNAQADRQISYLMNF